MPRCLLGLVYWICCVWAVTRGAAAEDVSFRRDVMAVLAKTGCNQGTCHGNASGKGGFQLSLRGQSPDQDYAVLKHDWTGRRINAMEPEQSLLLQKATMQVPHVGGRRFQEDSPEYQILRDWIAAGLPNQREAEPRLVKLEVTPAEVWLSWPRNNASFQAIATFADGHQKNVTSLVVLEPVDAALTAGPGPKVQSSGPIDTTVLVRYLEEQVPVRFVVVPDKPKPDLQAEKAQNLVDRHILAKLEQLRIQPSGEASDSQFVRRIYLDLLGVLPTASEARLFVESTNPEKRAVLIDRLLDRPEYAAMWALKWADMLRVEEKTLDRKGVGTFHAWLQEAFARNRPLDELVAELVAARGSTYETPPANFYRALRDPYSRAEGVAQLFLGVRLQCAKCHNHLFDRWTQDDYYAWSNVFSRVEYKILSNARRDSNDKHEFIGEQIVWMPGKGDVADPRTKQPRPPRFLGVDQPIPAGEDRLQALSAWLTAPENDRFAQVMTNRLWAQVFGVGIVEPVDDFRASNPPSHPQLLAELTSEMRESGFNQKHVLRIILNSQTYQRDSQPNATNAEDERNFSHAVVRRLSAEQLLDAVLQVTGETVTFAGYPTGTRAGQLAGVSALRSREQKANSAEAFLRLFGRPPRLQSCDCERTEEATLNQTFQLVSGELLQDLLAKPNNRLNEWLSSDAGSRDLVEQLSWTALSRAPTEEELKAGIAYLESQSDRRAALEDLCWAVLNSHEFLLRR